MALAAKRYLSDDPMSVRKAVSTSALSSGTTFLPGLSVGRLVESPTEIPRTIATFIGQDGILDLTDPTKFPPATGHKALVTGYDFLTNAATQMRTRWKSALHDLNDDPSTAPVNGSLIGNNWGNDPGTALRNALAGHYGVMALSGHAAHFEEGVPGAQVGISVNLTVAGIGGEM
jgi:hypothetical protein